MNPVPAILLAALATLALTPAGRPASLVGPPADPTACGCCATPESTADQPDTCCPAPENEPESTPPDCCPQPVCPAPCCQTATILQILYEPRDTTCTERRPPEPLRPADAALRSRLPDDIQPRPPRA